MKGFYFITDADLSRLGNYSDVRKAVSAGVEVVQYRNKTASTQALYSEALRLRKICRKTLFLVNDRVDIALAVGADGVHLGQQDLPYQAARRLLGKEKIIGITVHNLKEARLAQKIGADYIAASPVFSTGTKSDAGKPLGLALFKDIAGGVSIPVVAIGGINLKNAPLVIKAGASALCAISAVVTKRDVKKETRKFQEIFKKWRYYER